MRHTHAPSIPQQSVRPASPPRPLPQAPTTMRPRPPPPQEEERPSKSSRSSCGCTPTAAASTCARPSRGGACGWWSRRRRGARRRRRGTGTKPYVCVYMGDCALCFIQSVCLSGTDTCIHDTPKSSKKHKRRLSQRRRFRRYATELGPGFVPSVPEERRFAFFLEASVLWYDDSDTHTLV